MVAVVADATLALLIVIMVIATRCPSEHHIIIVVLMIMLVNVVKILVMAAMMTTIAPSRSFVPIQCCLDDEYSRTQQSRPLNPKPKP